MRKENIVLGGSIFAAIGASLCCVGPILFALLGVGAFGASSVFQSLRPYLLAVAVLAIAFGFYRAYFRREACAPGEACATKPLSRASRAVLWFASLAVLAFALSPYYVGHLAAAIMRSKQQATSQPAVTSPTENAETNYFQSVTVKVDGMDCTSCEMPIKAAVELTPGVRSADVSYERGEARVEYDAKQTDVDRIKRAIDSTGYKTKK
jgi:copper chaperone CopZ